MIHISLSPNLEFDDVRAAVARLFMPWQWREHAAQQQLAEKLAHYVNAKEVMLTASGRGALMVLLRGLGIGEGDEVILQSFTCNAVANPIMWVGATPIYADIDDTFNIDSAKLEGRVTPRTKALIIQHTFGIPAKVEELLEVARRHNLIVIEDCAHALGASYRGRRVGSFGDVALFSFGRDKVISASFGGALAVNREELVANIRSQYENLAYPSGGWTMQQLLHPIISWFTLLTYGPVGKAIFSLAQGLRLVSRVVTRQEYCGEQPAHLEKKMPGALAVLALRQFHKLARFNEHRRELAALYARELSAEPAFKLVGEHDGGSIFLRYPVLHSRAPEVLRAARARGMVLGDWYARVIDPAGTDRSAMHYREGCCVAAEGTAPNIINLPTNIRTSRNDARRVVEFLHSWKPSSEK
ncbi:MAG: aminotransferase class I/II-fold pyridoxal phosphate-dependent enzyme [Candidatus Spechtbacterales bacterium]